MLKVLEGGKCGNPKSQDDEDGLGLGLALDELARQGARRMIAAALKVEAETTWRASQLIAAAMGARWWYATGLPVRAP